MWEFSLLKRGWFRWGNPQESGAERAARWLRERLETEARGRYAWLDAGVWADAAHAAHGVPRDVAVAAKRLTDVSLIGDEVALGG